MAMSPWLCVSQYGTCQLQLPRKAVCTSQFSTQTATTWAWLAGSKASHLNVPQLLVPCIILQFRAAMRGYLCIFQYLSIFSSFDLFSIHQYANPSPHTLVASRSLFSRKPVHLETFWKLTESDNKYLNVHLECTTQSQKLTGCLAHPTCSNRKCKVSTSHIFGWLLATCDCRNVGSKCRMIPAHASRNSSHLNVFFHQGGSIETKKYESKKQIEKRHSLRPLCLFRSLSLPLNYDCWSEISCVNLGDAPGAAVQ